MSESVSLPALGESVTEGTVTRWLKNVGDRVEVDEDGRIRGAARGEHLEPLGLVVDREPRP